MISTILILCANIINAIRRIFLFVDNLFLLIFVLHCVKQTDRFGMISEGINDDRIKMFDKPLTLAFMHGIFSIRDGTL